jgi:hypothetical protein
MKRMYMYVSKISTFLAYVDVSKRGTYFIRDVGKRSENMSLEEKRRRFKFQRSDKYQIGKAQRVMHFPRRLRDRIDT